LALGPVALECYLMHCWQGLPGKKKQYT
jgi:hypothetical protein